MSRFCVLVIEGEGFAVEADRLEDCVDEGIYKLFLNKSLQGKFVKTHVQGYFWDVVPEHTHD